MMNRDAQVVHRLAPLELKLPFWRYAELFAGRPHHFLLDSARDPEKLGRYSFIGGDPFLVFSAKRRPGAGPGAPAAVEIQRFSQGGAAGASSVERSEAEPLGALRELYRRYAVPSSVYEQGQRVPFHAGAVGYFGYEAGYFVERLPDAGADDLALPDIWFMFVDWVLAHDAQTGQSFLSVLGRGATEAEARASMESVLSCSLAAVRAYEAQPRPAWRGPAAEASEHDVDVHAHFDEAGYAALVEEAKEHIVAGDIFEVCATHRLDAPFGGDAWDLYSELRRINPAPFACYLRLPGAAVVSSSPERFLRLGPDRVAESRPIKGTRPRGKDAAEDQALRQDLESSIKDRAENVMIVDLVRNDLGRVCEVRSVHVPELMIIETYATVFQMVSTIRGTLRADKDLFDLIAACFPGGSMTGAPKIEAMKIIDALEPVKRGIYSGSIGYLDFGDTFDLNIVIRTLVVKDGRAYFSVGGAIVSDSDPVGEYRETVDKARALRRALANVERATR